LAALLHLGPAALAGLYSFTLIDVMHRRLAPWLPRFYAKTVALALFVGLMLIGGWMGVRFLRQSLTAIPEILERVMPRFQELAIRYQVDLPFEDVDGLRVMLVDMLKENVRNVTHAGGVLTRGLFHVAVGILVAALGFMAE